MSALPRFAYMYSTPLPVESLAEAVTLPAGILIVSFHERFSRSPVSDHESPTYSLTSRDGSRSIVTFTGISSSLPYGAVSSRLMESWDCAWFAFAVIVSLSAFSAPSFTEMLGGRASPTLTVREMKLLMTSPDALRMFVGVLERYTCVVSPTLPVAFTENGTFSLPAVMWILPTVRVSPSENTHGLTSWTWPPFTISAMFVSAVQM